MRVIALAVPALCVLVGMALYPAHGDKDEDNVEPEKEKNPIVVIELDKGGVIEFELFPKDAPIAVENIIKLIDKKYYDGLVFHRVEPGFVVQTGCPQGVGTGGPGWTIKDEKSPRKHLKGSVGMAKTPRPDSAGSQFYICLDKAPFLDGNYTVFGQVTKGMDLAEKIKVGDKMKKVTVRKPADPAAESSEEPKS